ncbi:hypothetical protein SAMN02910298_01963 [Pseudobutyrivibrio sp. YE44]|uniref:hypothetical protein n=1 Tax=Pseudobutyrivibrio sp. YE44 TaxID=1520802 RepID=UPI000883EDF8|nr:hypothetical protein [Pseudobutyrivibrio sp. YE44]SDB40153.1 hypothetical protein SAMN02910298_01963 [Pseudobutyrivibrio sp. YE44]
MELMNENRKMEMLNSFLVSGESFQATMWGTIMADAKAIMGIAAGMNALGIPGGGAVGALANQYCYVGVSENYLSFCCISNIDPSVMTGGFVLAFADIIEAKVKKGLFGRRVISIKTNEGKMNLSFVGNTIGSRLSKVKQVAGIEYLVDRMMKL